MADLIYTYTPSVSFCPTTDCTSLRMNISSVGNPNFFQLEDITLTVTDTSDDSVIVNGLSIISSLVVSATGTSTITTGTNQVIGTATAFLSEFEPGDYIAFSSYPTEVYQVASVASNTSMFLTTYFWGTASPTETMKVVTLYYDLSATTMGGTTTVPSGVYEFKIIHEYPIGFYASEYVTYTTRAVICCTDYCCVYGKIADLANSCDDCVTQDQVIDAMFAWALLMAAQGNAGCGQIADATTILEKLEKYCNNQPCDC